MVNVHLRNNQPYNVLAFIMPKHGGSKTRLSRKANLFMLQVRKMLLSFVEKFKPFIRLDYYPCASTSSQPNKN